MKRANQTQFIMTSLALSVSVLVMSVGCSTDESRPPIGRFKHKVDETTELHLADKATEPKRDEETLPEPLAHPQIMRELHASEGIKKEALRQLTLDQTSRAKSRINVDKPATPDASVGSVQIDLPVQIVENTEKYQTLNDNPVIRVVEQSTSTFSIDVDTGAYSNVRRFLNSGQMPPVDAVRMEELVNYFRYDYATPASTNVPFSIHTELASSPWNPKTRLLHIGLKGYNVAATTRPPANLVFLLDVSGSMAADNKLGLLKSSIKMLTKELNDNDRVSIVVYAGASGVVLKPTPGNNTRAINAALSRLNAGGSTNGQAGIEQAYAMAEDNMSDGSINRIILATDGDFNVGMSNIDTLKKLIEQKRESGIALTTLGFGTGNYNDHLMEQLADVGNGSYAYIDTLNEARKVLSEEMTSTLLTIAKDVKIQVEFNPEQVSEYRLLGYVNRHLANEDFANDKVDAGEIGAGHTVTALYEVALIGEGGEWNSASRYQPTQADKPLSNEIAEVRLRFKQPNENKSQLITRIVKRTNLRSDLTDTSNNFKFAASVAGFGQLLRQSKYIVDFGYADVAQLATQAKGEDRFGYRSEFVQLVNLADSLDQRSQAKISVRSQDQENEG